MIISKKEFRHFIHDRLSIFLFLGSAILGIVNMMIVILQVRSSDLQIPIRYTEYSYNLFRGNWTILYELALFAVLIICINTLLAIKVRPLRRLYALGVLILTLVLMIIALLVTNALIGLIAA